ncbi:unnamed protein product [Rotaria sordida]|uniref:B box-type domain-containing protein n=1 Tax=Rotaria sordida TaxID=392033 RepID=A0A814ZUL0_9BILA|nr:unnamed protein product [Rotaria sordida]
MASNNPAIMKCFNECSLKAGIWCDECNKSYCLKCSHIIHKIPTLRTHERIPIDKRPWKLMRCKIHSDENEKYWCYECKKTVCHNCQIVDHNNHSVIDIIDIVEDIVERLKNELQCTQSSFEETFKNVQQMISSSEHIYEDKITEVFTSIRILINELSRSTIVEKGELLQVNEELTNNIEEVAQSLKQLKPPIIDKYNIDGIDELKVAVDGVLKRVIIPEKQEDPVKTSESNGSLMNSQLAINLADQHLWEKEFFIENKPK